MPRIPLGSYIERAINWLLHTFGWLFDGISHILTTAVDGLTRILTGPPAPVWIAVFTLAALLAARWPLAVYTVAAFALIQSLGLWTPTMQTLASVLIATVIATAIAIPTGIFISRHAHTRVALRPVLDFMQTTPAFVYLIPAVFFFGIGVVPGVVATMIFAIPPGIRLTDLGIRQVDREAVEAAWAFGARPRQILREIQLPLALPSIMAGINQVIMLALSMVVVAGLAGAGGLGSVVVGAVTQLDVATGFEGGLAVVILAIYLDRLTSGLAAHSGRTKRRGLLPWGVGRKQQTAVPAVAEVPHMPGDAAPSTRDISPAPSRHEDTDIR